MKSISKAFSTRPLPRHHINLTLFVKKLRHYLMNFS
jgi:hypothetical protein